MDKKENSKLSRRNLLKVIAAGGAAATVGVSGCTQQQQGTTTKYACPYCDKEFESQSKLKTHIQEDHPQEISDIKKSGVITWEPEKCASCSRCLMACSAYHDGSISYKISRILWEDDDYIGQFEFRRPLLCQQCDSPECFYACPIEGAMYIDEETGARCIDEEKCTGCGECVEACPFEPTRVLMKADGDAAIKCDLCSDREGGPVCVEVCDRNALTYVTSEEREGGT
ncbi:MAG: Fe-S-cluster-containing hydrogenase component 2, HycB [Candidatus Methanohalarchaeum thermophilum]|uniref:Fe-S-cluster-containing hydrogenase component 2, HycB n=1 Tax=Methanohalarchaeum thermophilum TaxID=1903181 RepID=A0A1Q6DUF9_METT1|nr:MAG: Fe-S-cluster-containing hydrogenase component 2, HycB [Candidatus Methanohalarchaeum thermophilum]